MGWWYPFVKKTKEEKAKAKAELWEKKEKFYIPKPDQFPCPDDSHPLFTIKATVERPGVCYYCSKVFIVKENEDED